MRYLAGCSLMMLLFLANRGLADEKKIALDQVPRPVLDALKAKFPGAEFKGAEQEDEEGTTVYEVSFVHQGQKYEAECKADGGIIAVDRQIQVSDLPAAVAHTLKERWPKAKIKKVE